MNAMHEGEKSNARERNFGVQPIAGLLEEAGLRAHDLVAVSAVPMTHKLVARACKGRWLTPRSRDAVLAALNAATGKSYLVSDLFTYTRKRVASDKS